MKSTFRLSCSHLANLSLVATLFFMLISLGMPQTAAADAAEPTASAEEAEKPQAKQADSKGKPEKGEKAESDKEQGDAKKIAEEPEKKESAGEEKEGEEKKDEGPKAPELSGVFEARKMTEITVRPQSWSVLKVLTAAPHGQRVSQGQLLLALELEGIDQAIADLRDSNRLSDLAIVQAEVALKALESKTPLSQEAADRTRRIAKEDFDYYTKVARPMELKTLDFSLKSAKRRLEYQEEELRQLEEMYKADEVTEETEEIILQRARNSVEMARFMYEGAKLSHAKQLKYDLPRTDETKKDALAQAEIAWQSTRSTLPVALKKQKLELAKLKLDRERSEEKLEKLLADRTAMIVKAPVAGVLYYGQCDRGSWSSAAATAKKLRLGGSISPNEVVMTLVQNRPVFIRSTLDEKDLSKIHVGDKCTVVPTGFPETKLSAVVQEIGGVPIDSGKFDVTVTPTSGKLPEAIVPGMSCKVKFAAEEKAEGAES